MDTRPALSRTLANGSSMSTEPLVRRTAGPTIFEAGHYYAAKGPTQWSEMGWNILSTYTEQGDGRLLFIDDVHASDQLPSYERDLENIAFNPHPEPTHTILESEVLEDAEEALKVLKILPRRKRARKTGRGKVLRCSGFPLKNSKNEPTCLFLDIGLTWRKYKFGFTHAVNILPAFYESEQQHLYRIMRKALPQLTLDVILFDLDGTKRALVPKA